MFSSTAAPLPCADRSRTVTVRPYTYHATYSSAHTRAYTSYTYTYKRVHTCIVLHAHMYTHIPSNLHQTVGVKYPNSCMLSAKNSKNDTQFVGSGVHVLVVGVLMGQSAKTRATSLCHLIPLCYRTPNASQVV